MLQTLFTTAQSSSILLQIPECSACTLMAAACVLWDNLLLGRKILYRSALRQLLINDNEGGFSLSVFQQLDVRSLEGSITSLISFQGMTHWNVMKMQQPIIPLLMFQGTKRHINFIICHILSPVVYVIFCLQSFYVNNHLLTLSSKTKIIPFPFHHSEKGHVCFHQFLRASPNAKIVLQSNGQEWNYSQYFAPSNIM